MANSKIVIEVIDGGGRNKEPIQNPAVKQDSAKDIALAQKRALYRRLHPIQAYISDKENFTEVQTFAIERGIALSKQIANSIFNYYVSDIGRYTGDTAYANVVNRTIEQVTDVTSIFSSMSAGAMSGALLGPPGMIIGAAVGAASSVISTATKYAMRERNYLATMDKLNSQQEYMLGRTGANSIYTGRLR